MSMPIILFSHGKESGPNGYKLNHLSTLARAKGFECDSLDYRSLDKEARVAKLNAAIDDHEAVILVGSSMGGLVSLLCAGQDKVKALFLMAPAVYMESDEQYSVEKLTCSCFIIHGWQDDIVSIENSLKLARQLKADFRAIDSDHGLNQQIEIVGHYFSEFLKRISA